jgi:hypothetical protein
MPSSSLLAAALACASSLTGLPLPPAEFPIVWYDEKPDVRWCAQGGWPHVVRATESSRGVRFESTCYGVTAGGPQQATIRAPAEDWLTLVHESCHVLQKAAGGPSGAQAEMQCRRIEHRAWTCRGAQTAMRAPLDPGLVQDD